MLQIEDLHVSIETAEGDIQAVENVSLQVKRGETVGIVGESGSGKSVLAQSIVRLNHEPLFSYPAGDILFEGKSILSMKEKDIRHVRGQDISFVFQDPMSSL